MTNLKLQLKLNPNPKMSEDDEDDKHPQLNLSFPDEVLDNILLFITTPHDRNTFSQVCRSWYKAEAVTRYELFIGNCYSTSPTRAIQRFQKIKSLVLKGKPRFADFNLIPVNWGAHFNPWVTSMAIAYPWLEKIYLKRMLVTDEDLFIVSHLLPGFKELVLDFCEGFSTKGLAAVASNCRYTSLNYFPNLGFRSFVVNALNVDFRQLRVLDLIEDVDVDDDCDWISCFPETETCLECLAFDCVKTPVNFEALEELVARSPSLKKLRVNQYVTIQQLHQLMVRAPQLRDLGTGSFISNDFAMQVSLEQDLSVAFAKCRSLESLSGFSDIVPDYLHTMYPVCGNLLSLNFSYADINAEQLKAFIQHCRKLQRIWVLDTIGDEGLEAVAASCKELQELRVFPMDVREDGEAPVTERGLISISQGCRKLQSILYFCLRMTNEAVVAMSRNCPELRVFRLCMMGRHLPDHLTGEPMDDGFGAIVMNCKKLTRLALSGLLTDKAFSYIGQYGKKLKTLSVAFAGDSDRGLRHVLEECPKLLKLEIRDSPFGDESLLSGLHHYHNMRFVWMSSCDISLDGCTEVARRLPQLAVEVIRDPNVEHDGEAVEKLYMYRSLEARRSDAPKFVSIL